METMRTDSLTMRDASLLDELSMPQLRIDLSDIRPRQAGTAEPPVSGDNSDLELNEFPDYNPLLD
jgi:hypothetical protein